MSAHSEFSDKRMQLYDLESDAETQVHVNPTQVHVITLPRCMLTLLRCM